MTVKTITRTRTKTTTTAPVKKAFALIEGARPERGAKLYAHTYAVLRFFRLTEGGSIAKKTLESFMGVRAVSYHIGRRNLVTGVMGITQLTERGTKVFEARRVAGKFDEVLSNAYLAAFSGKVSTKHGISKDMLEPVTL